jgi:alanine dehydrogenase
LIENAKIKAAFATDGLKSYLLKNNKKKLLTNAINNLDNKLTYVIVNYSYATNELIKLILKANNDVVLCESNKAYEHLIKNDTHIINALSKSIGKLTLLDSTFDTLVEETKKADVVINTTTIPGDKTHLKITHEMIKNMKNNCIFIDLGADQGIGCEDVKCYNTVKKPFSIIENKVFICLNNIPSIFALESSKYTSEFICSIVSCFEKDTIETIKNDIHIKNAIQTFGRELTNQTIGKALTLTVTNI